MLENDMGKEHLVDKASLETLLSEETDALSNIDLVFLAACTSERNGELFTRLGVKHVICITAKKTVRDRAIIEFSERFYSKLLELENVCSAFKCAREYLDATEDKD
jgi:hypothetical protein